MAGYDGVRDAVESVVGLLRTHVTDSDDAGLSGIPVRPDSPRELEVLNLANAVSVWLHRVEIDRDLANRGPGRPTPDRQFRRPLPVRLALAIVPLNTDAPTRLLLLGRIAQVLDEHRTLAGSDLAGGLATDGTVLLLSLDTPGGYELSQLWSSLQTYARPSVCATVAGLTLDAHHADRPAHPVLDAVADTGQIVGAVR